MSVLYCTIPHFAAALERRDNAGVRDRPLVLIGPEKRVLGVSAEAAACGVASGMTARTAEIHCPEACLLEADMARCRAETEVLLQLLEKSSPSVEPHGWGAAYVDLGNRSAERSRRSLARDHADAVSLCRDVGQAVRQEMGTSFQPALGWDNSKFTAQIAARRTQPGHLRAVDSQGERTFLRPLPVTLLPLAGDTLQRLCFLGLRTLGQYATLPQAAVWQQFGRPGVLAHRCAKGKDDRPVIPRGQAPRLAAATDFETALAGRENLVAALRHLVSPLLADLRENFQACGQVRLTVRFDDRSSQEGTRTFLLPVSEEDRVVRALEQLLDRLRWPAGAAGLDIALEQIQDAVAEQLSLFSLQHEVITRQSQEKLEEVRRYLVARFGANSLRRAVLSQPAAPLAEWRAGWLDEAEP